MVYIIDFLIMQAYIVWYTRSLLKKEIAGTSIRAFGAVILLEIVCIYNLYNEISTIKIIYETITEMLQSIYNNLTN